MFEWKCIGKYFNTADEISESSTFTNDAEMPLIILNGNAVDSLINENDECYLHTNGSPVSKLIYKIDNIKSETTDLPCKITFKARIFKYGRVNGIVKILNNIYIRFEILNDLYVPCISKSDDSHDPYMPLNNVIDGSWFNVDISWANSQLIVKINDNVVLYSSSDNIISTDEHEIINCDNDAEFCMDIKDLKFWKLLELSHESSRTKIIKYNKNNKLKLGVIAHPDVDFLPVDDESVYRIQLSEIPAGTYIPVSKLLISGCTFNRNEVVSPYNECYKVYTDDITGKEVKIHVYFYPKVNHSSNVMYNVAYYNTNISQNDVLNIDTELYQNGVNLCGRIISWDSSDLTSNIYKSFMFKTVISTSVIRDSFKALEGSYIYPNGFKVVVTTSTDKGSGGIFGGSFKNTVFKSVDSDNTDLIQNATFTYNNQDLNVVLSSNSSRTDDNDSSLYKPYRLFHEYDNILTDINTEVVSQEITATTTENIPLIYTMDFDENTPLGVIEGFNFYTGCIDPDCGITKKLKVELIDKTDNSIVKCYEYNNLSSSKTHYSFFNDLVYYNIGNNLYEETKNDNALLYKIVITSPKGNGYQDLLDFKFENLDYVDCNTAWDINTSYSLITSEEIIFSGIYKNETKFYRAVVSYESPTVRWSDNSVGDWDPHNFFADNTVNAGRKYTNGTQRNNYDNHGICASGSEDLIFSIRFIDPVPYELIRDFSYNTGDYRSFGTHHVDLYTFYNNPVCSLSLEATTSHYTMSYSFPDILYTARLIVYRTSHSNYPMICQMAFDNISHASGTDTSHTDGTAVFENENGVEINAVLHTNYNVNADTYPNILFEMPSSTNPNPYYIFYGYMGSSTPYDNSGLTYDIKFSNNTDFILNYKIQLGCKEGHSASQIDAFGSQLISRYDETELLVSECMYTNPTPSDSVPVYVDFVNNTIEAFSYYKLVITKERGSIRNSTIANGVFENLTYAGRRTQNYTSNITTVDIYFNDPNGNEIECTCSYLSSRWSDNGVKDYAPCNFFARTADQSWANYSSDYSEVSSGNGSNLKFEILFKTKIPLKYINNLTFDNGRFSGNKINVIVYHSNDLSNFVEIINKNLPSGNSYTFTV